MNPIETAISSFLEASPPSCVARSATVGEAAHALQTSGTGCVLVVEGGRLAGIFTERDFLNRVAAKNVSLEGTPVADVMTASPETLRPEDDIRFAINKMAIGGFRHVPIVDADEKPVGVINVRKVIDHMATVFATVEHDGGSALDEWVDVGGG